MAIPALILTAVLDAIGIKENGAIYRDGFQSLAPGLLLRTFLFIGEQWNAHRFPGSNSPYWSLGFEVWYYVAFGTFLFAPRRWRLVATFAVLAFIGPKVALMFPAWLMGVLVYRICATQKLPQLAGWMLFAFPMGLFAGYEFMPHSDLQQYTRVTLDAERLRSTGQDYFISILFSVHLIGFSTVSGKFGPWLERHARCIRWISGATFSLYLAHLPIMRLLAAFSPWPKSSLWMVFLLVAVTPVACLAFAEISERRKDAWRLAIVVGLRKLRILKTRGVAKSGRGSVWRTIVRSLSVSAIVSTCAVVIECMPRAHWLFATWVGPSTRYPPEPRPQQPAQHARLQEQSSQAGALACRHGFERRSWQKTRS